MGKKHKKHHKSDKVEKLTVDEDKPTPLKIVLKVGGATTAIPETSTDAISSEFHDSERRHKHKKKKKKKSSEKEKHRHGEHGEEKSEKHKKDRKRERSQIEVADAPTDVVPPPTKRVLTMEPEPFESFGSPGGQPRKSEFGNSQLQACLDYLHKQLQRKDVNGFFAFPVTDNIAPGYSSIIHHPMDFSTMKTKIENHEYQNVSEYRKDFKLMCDNCITYNRPETVYYKESKRLLSIGHKLMSKEKLLMMKKSLSFMATISNEELGIDDEEANTILAGGATEPMPKPPKSKPKSKPKPSKFEAIPDNMTPEEILAAAREAAKDAADELTMRKPKSKGINGWQPEKIGFLRRRPDGTTTLNILNPDNDGIVSEKERIVDLGTLTGKLTSGTGNISGFKEDKRNKANPVNYLSYGPYSSFAPSYDSSFSNITKEDTDLLLATYGDETGLQYALSLKNFVENAGYATNMMMDSLLNVLTGNEHSKANQLLQQRKKEAQDMVRLAEERKEAKESGRPGSDDVDFDSLRNLSDELGIDMSFLDSFERNYKPAPRTVDESRIDAKLQETSQLIRDLQKTQNERLSRKLPAHLANVPKPSEKEVKLAEKVTQQLTELTKEAMPADIVSVSALRKAMGVALGPTEGGDQSEGEDIEELMETTPAEPTEENIVTSTAIPTVTLSV